MKIDFMIIGTMDHDSKDSAIDYLQKLLKDNENISEINTIHIFGDTTS